MMPPKKLGASKRRPPAGTGPWVAGEVGLEGVVVEVLVVTVLAVLVGTAVSVAGELSVVIGSVTVLVPFSVVAEVGAGETVELVVVLSVVPLSELVNTVGTVTGADAADFDVSDKPPGTNAIDANATTN